MSRVRFTLSRIFASMTYETEIIHWLGWRFYIMPDEINECGPIYVSVLNDSN